MSDALPSGDLEGPARPGGRLSELARRLPSGPKKQRRSGGSSVLDAASQDTVDAPGAGPVRHEPYLVWDDPERAPVGAFGPARPNHSLRVAQIPRPGDPWDNLGEFALSYDGYAYWDNLGELANLTMRTWKRDQTLPGDLDRLRGSLFYEQRRWHHLGGEPRGRSSDYVRALVVAIRDCVAHDVEGVTGSR